MTNNMIEIKNIRKGFGDKSVIDDVSTVFKTGKCNLIIGTSGSGKTVMMKCLVGLFEPDSGEIIYDGFDFDSIGTDEPSGNDWLSKLYFDELSQQ